MGFLIKVDFTGIETFSLCAEGEHEVKIKSLEQARSSSGDEQYIAIFQVISGASQGATLRENFTNSKTALWKLKQMYLALGLNADGKSNIDSDKLLGKKCIVEVVHDEYQKRKIARIAQFISKEVAEDDSEIADISEDDSEPEEITEVEEYEEDEEELEPVEDVEIEEVEEFKPSPPVRRGRPTKKNKDWEEEDIPF